MEQTYTVREMVAHLATTKTEAEISLLTRQIRHWTLSDLLRPVGDKFTGVGRHRVYPAIELYVALLLRTVAPFTGTMTHMRRLRSSVDEWLADPNRRSILNGTERGYVTVKTGADGTLYWSLNEGIPDKYSLIEPSEDGERYEQVSAALIINCRQLAYEAGLIEDDYMEFLKQVDEEKWLKAQKRLEAPK